MAIRWVWTLRVFFVASLAGLLVVGALALDKLTFSNDTWLDDTHPVEKAFDLLVEDFAPGESLWLIFTLEKDFFASPASKNALDDLARQFAKSPHVMEVLWVMSAKTFFRQGDSLYYRQYSEALQEGLFETVAHLQDRFSQSPYAGRLLSKDGLHVAFKLTVNTRENPTRRADTVQHLLALAQSFAHEREDITTVRVLGEAAFNADLNARTKDSFFLFTALSLGVLMLFMLCFLRPLSRGILVCLLSLASVSVTLALMAYSGVPATVATVILCIIVLIITIADALHVLACFDHDIAPKMGDETRKPFLLLRLLAARCWWPCFLTSLTSAVALGSFSLSSLLPLQSFGIVAGICVFAALLITLVFVWAYVAIFTPAFLVAQKRKHHAVTQGVCAPRAENILQRFLDHILARVAGFVTKVLNAKAKATRRFLWLSGVLLLAGLLPLGLLRTETNLLDVFYSPESTMYQAFTFADKNLKGANTVDILWKETPGYFETMKALQVARALQQALENLAPVLAVDSYLIPLRQIHRHGFAPPAKENGRSEPWQDLPREENALSQELLFLDISRGDDGQSVLAPYMTLDYSSSRWRLAIPSMSSDKTSVFLTSVRQLFAENGVAPDAITLTGQGGYFHHISNLTFKTQIVSLTTAVLLVTVVFVVFFGWALGMVGVVVGVVPVLLSLAAMALAQVPLDFSTVLVANLALGLCVDDAAHMLHRYRIARSDGGTVEAAVRASILVPGRAIITSSVVFLVGGAVFLFADLVSLWRFGMFFCVAVVLSSLMSLVFLPVLAGVFGKKSSRYLLKSP